MMFLIILFWLILLLIFHTMIGYPLSLNLIWRFSKKKNNVRDLSLRPYVSIIVPAHNEEAVIEQKLNNLIQLNYPKELFEIIISSDNSTDRTNEIVNKFIEEHKDYDVTGKSPKKG
jgi:cellulose synthase/poly-beta-1,6-N-acetylglucosamine synthase-like glycosyltransferase